MSFFSINPQLQAGGDIYPSRFVKVSASADYTALQAGANDAVIGISGPGVNQPPGLAGSTLLHAWSGRPCQVYGPADGPVPLRLGDTVTRGQWLKPDANGKGVPCSLYADAPGALALQSGADDEIIDVIVFPSISRTTMVFDATTFASAGGTLSVNDSGKIFLVGAGSLTINLPATVAGVTYTFIMNHTGAFNLSPVADDAMLGNGFTVAADKDAIFATAARGNTFQVVGDGVDGWYIREVHGTLTREG